MKKFLVVLVVVATALFVTHGTVSAAECNETAPVGAPSIFQIDRNSTSAVLHVIPAGVPYTEYVVSYGFNEGDERFGATFPQGATNDNLKLTISNLDPGSSYYFKVRAGNNCQTGQWSAWYSSKGSAVLAAEDTASASAATLPETGTPQYLFYAMFALPIILLVGGLVYNPRRNS